MITISINNQKISCEEGEYVIDVARRNHIFIPTICYLGGCSPTLACKMCMGETADGKRVYTCNTRTKDGLEIFTNTPAIIKERQEIMQTYDVNHPLECGVCDKSGECELQNLTLYTKVSHQDYALPDDEKLPKSWAQALYDPNLCIMCERCVTTCKDNIGENKLKAEKAELHSPDSYKDSMNKDPYSVWSKKQKSLISFVSDTPCFDCGECIAVCPVGALSYKDFSYSANAWELSKTPSTCSHCSMGCQVIYESRHFNTQGDKRIYRVKNDFTFQPICGAARFGFSLYSKDLNSKNKSEILESILLKLKSAKALRIGDVSNEEALIIENLAKHLNLKIYNQEAKAYQSLLKILPLNHTTDELKNSLTIITLGNAFRLQSPHIQYAINNTIKTKKSIKLFYMQPFLDSVVASFSRSVQSITYAPNSEILALCALLVAIYEKSNNAKLENLIGEILKSKVESSAPEPTPDSTSDSSNQDSNAPDSSQTQKVSYKIFDDHNISLDVFRDMAGSLDNASLVVGADIFHSQNAKNLESIALALGFLEYECGVKIYIATLGANTAGIARICTLIDDDLLDSGVLGIRAKGEITFDCAWHDDKGLLGNIPDFILPSLKQMQGSITNFENRLLPLSQALDYDGLSLLDVANYALKDSSWQDESTLSDYTHKLPKERGFLDVKYKNLKNFFTQGGEDKRGYALAKVCENLEFKPLELKLESSKAYNSYISYPQSIFSLEGVLDSNLQQKDGFYTSKANLERLCLQEGAEITLELKGKDSSKEIKGKVFVDYGLVEDFWLISPNISQLESNTYLQANVTKSSVAQTATQNNDVKEQE